MSATPNNANVEGSGAGSVASNSENAVAKGDSGRGGVTGAEVQTPL